MLEQLKTHLSSASSAETREALIQGIQNSYQKSLLILKMSGSVTCQPQPVPAAKLGPDSVPASTISSNGSPCGDDFDWGLAAREQFDSIETSKKR